ncbi:transcriptional regulator FtsR [Agromyces silvae]|uniref:transcriptional regulator FtsR n=1 Tax=Agromyces silvae TaxID=3388266 RepID=UPI00280B9B97|nr:MerR family transcriptional regulator [Agromyces protaetiae]
MARSAASQAAGRGVPLLGIGQVLARLQPEFPELTPSKLRFLEEQGLVTPARTPSGYRKFAPGDVERIGFVLAMQRDHYLPLKVIRTHLEAIDAGETPALPGAAPAAQVTRAPRFRRDELARAAGAPPSLLDEAVSAGLLPAADDYGDDALEVMQALAMLRAVGIEPRHLRGVRFAAERDAALIERAIAPARRNDPAGRARSMERALDLGRQLETIHGSILRSALTKPTR